MKTILFLVLFFLPFLSFSQDVTAPYGLQLRDSSIVFEYIVNAPGVKEEIIYAAAHKWIADNFKYAKSMVQTEEREIGQIIATGTIQPDYSLVYSVRFQLQIDCRDNKYRIRFYNLSVSGLPQPDVSIPFETYVFGDSAKLSKPKQLEKAKQKALVLKYNFEAMKKSIVESIDNSSKDTF